MNELFRVDCKTDYEPAWYDFFVPNSILGIITYKRTFVFYDDRFEIRKGDDIVLTVPYADIIQEKTIALNKTAILVCCKGAGEIKSLNLNVSILKLSTEDRDKILSIIKK